MPNVAQSWEGEETDLWEPAKPATSRESLEIIDNAPSTPNTHANAKHSLAIHFSAVLQDLVHDVTR